MSYANGYFRRFLLPISAFVAGFSLMTVELTASRILAAHFGSSIYMWTIVIGIVLLGYSAGSAVGGVFADRFRSHSTAFLALIGASIFVGAARVLVRLLPALAVSALPLTIIIGIASVLLFCLPAFFLGAVYPILVRLAAESFERVGVRAGQLSALSALGSIAGTFLTGFVFIGYLGSSSTLLVVAVALLANAAAFVRPRTADVIVVAIIAVLLASAWLLPRRAEGLVYQDESNYYTVRVVDADDSVWGDARMLFLDFDSHNVESRSGKTLRTFTSIHPLLTLLRRDMHDVFVIGGGSYAMPKNLIHLIPDANITVAEIDPQVTAVAKEYFNVSNYPSIRIVTGDGRVALARQPCCFDLILEDAFNSFISTPWNMLTREFLQTARSKLKSRGIYVANLVAIPLLDRDGFLSSVLGTFSSVFPNYYILAFGQELFAPQNVVLVGINGDLPISALGLQGWARTLPNGEWLASVIRVPTPTAPDDALVLTDDFAPVERLLSSTINDFYAPYARFFYSVMGGRGI
jgi:spermidine synthase